MSPGAHDLTERTALVTGAHDFTGRTALVTGAGRGLGRAYALLLAERGAAVVVNDRGSSITGQGSDAEPATTVADEITEAGGMAVADVNDVSDPAGAAAMVAAAINLGGGIDIVINNAGIVRWAGPDTADLAIFEQHVAVHLHGSFNTVRAAWPHLVEQAYGRIVMTTSTGMLGLPANLSYAAAKGGVFGLTRSLAVAGRPHGILVNAIAPAAMTRMADPAVDDSSGHPLDPARAAPMAAYLAHEACPCSGEVFTAGAGRFARLFLASTPGWVHDGKHIATIEDVAAHWDQISEEAGYEVPGDLMAWSGSFLAHLSEAP